MGIRLPRSPEPRSAVRSLIWAGVSWIASGAPAGCGAGHSIARQGAASSTHAITEGITVVRIYGALPRLVVRRRKRFQFLQALHGLHRLDRIIIYAGGVQAAARLERIVRQRRQKRFELLLHRNKQ